MIAQAFLITLLLSNVSMAENFESKDVLEIPWMIWTHTVTAPGADGCPAAPYKAEVRMLPCEPDPHEEMCKWVSKELKTQASKYETQIKSYTDVQRPLLKKTYETALKTLGPVPLKKDPRFPNYKRAFFGLVAAAEQRNLTNEKNRLSAELEKSRPKVMAAVKKTKEYLLQAVAGSKHFSKHLDLFKRIFDCKINLQLQYEKKMTGNAWIGKRYNEGLTQTRTKVRELTRSGKNVILSHTRPQTKNTEDVDEVAVNPLVEESFLDCELTMTPKTWLECADSTETCFHTLAHEFGHLVNSCGFTNLARQAKEALAEVPPDTQEVRAEADVLEFLNKQSTKIAQDLIQASSCLQAVSAPKMAVLNTCPEYKPLPNDYRKRCGVGQVTGYEAQWEEAEADFWAASALAKRLETEFKSQSERVQKVYETWAYYCNTDELEKERNSFSPEIDEALKKIGDENESVVLCENTAATIGNGKPWEDRHQEWAVRANRNILRNSDLRKALGCPVKDSRIPLTCSPLN